MKYFQEINGDLHVCKNIATSDKVDKDKLIKIQKMKHFSMQSALRFWDKFDLELYKNILELRNNE